MKIYIAGPLTLGQTITEEQRLENIKYASDVGKLVYKLGHVPFIPHTMLQYWENDKSFYKYDYYIVDTTWLNLCDGILMLERWEHSLGSQWELAIATSLDKKIFMNIDQLKNYREK
jgi:hypothetical protein